ncbi:hypothetical protein WMF31_02720 [Sorangium sp. So ce1036]|uniref:hypothetical protein n=1 Tax=Sorangium sp. So ce1036 TaxID=3133328 RepID=UPI003F03F5B6
MTTVSVTLTGAAAASRPAAFRAHLIEFLLVGGATLVLFPLAWLAREAAGLGASELAVGFLTFHAASVINDPHFAVTYLLFYRDARRRAFGDAFAPMQRARYLVAGVLVPLALVAWSVAALATGSARTMGFMIQLMFLLVGWHYVKQGFGVLTVLSARRGFRFTPLERKVVLAHCFAGWAYAWASPADPGREVAEKGVIYTSFAHPPGIEVVTGAVFGLSALALIAALVRAWRAERRIPPLGPLAGFLITIWLWTVYSSLDRLMMYVIPALHSVQYLYFVWLLTRNEAREAEGPPSFGRPTGLRLGILAASAIGLGWVLLRGAPALLDGALVLGTSGGEAATDLGDTPYLAAIYVSVNIHHYFMDNVIWRRENPGTRYLLKPDAQGSAPAGASAAATGGSGRSSCT